MLSKEQVYSANRNGGLNVDVAANGIGVGADFVCTLDQLFGLFLIDSGNRDRKRGGQYESARVVATDTNFSSDFDVWVRESQPGLTTHTEERIFEAGGIAAGEELLRISGISLAAKLTGQSQLQIKQPVLAADVAVTASGGGNLGDIQIVRGSGGTRRWVGFLWCIHWAIRFADEPITGHASNKGNCLLCVL